MSNRDIVLWLIGSLIAVAVMIWTAIYLMDHYLFAESHAFSERASGAVDTFLIRRCDKSISHNTGTKLLKTAFPQGA